MYPEYSKSMDGVKHNVMVCHLSPHSAIMIQNR
jgi:hypothetical protein